MVEIKNLTRFYGNIPAVKNLSFTVEDGEILGFLGQTVRENPLP